MQERVRVVIIGAGIAGASVAYHLGQLGWKDIVVLDKGPLFKTGGSTSHAPGLVFQVNFSRMMSVFARETVQLYQRLHAAADEPLWFGVGGLEVATTPERLDDLKRKVGAGRAWGIDTGLLGPDEAREKIPLLADSIYGALYTPSDGIARAWQLAAALADHTQAAGAAQFYGNTNVTGIDVADGRVVAVCTDRGRIRTEAVVCAAGIWGRLIGQMAGVSLPLVPFCHLYAETAPLPELASETAQYRHPILRHQGPGDLLPTGGPSVLDRLLRPRAAACRSRRYMVARPSTRNALGDALVGRGLPPRHALGPARCCRL